MMKRIILGGVAGGVILFLWGFVSHEVLRLGSVGIQELPNFSTTSKAMSKGIEESGFYFFPGPMPTGEMSAEEKQAAHEAYAENYAKGPSGILIFNTGGSELNFTGMLITQCVTNILLGLIAAFLLAQVGGGGYVQRLVFVTLLGLFPSLAVNVPYWNWFGFPLNFSLASVADHMVGWLLAGSALAGIVKSSSGGSRSSYSMPTPPPAPIAPGPDPD